MVDTFVACKNVLHLWEGMFSFQQQAHARQIAAGPTWKPNLQTLVLVPHICVSTKHNMVGLKHKKHVNW